MGPLSDRFGRRPVILAALLLFLVASLGCLLASNVWVFLAFRMMQAVIAPVYAVSVAIIRDFSAGNKAASSIGYVAMASAVAPMLAPMLGGTLDELYGWRASFWAFLVMGGATLALCWLDLRETNKTPAATFARQFRSYGKLVGSGRFWGYALCMTFSRGAFFVFIGGASLVAVSTFRISTAQLGFYMGTITAGFVLGSFLCGRFSERYGLTTMMLTGGSVACVGLVLGILLCLLWRGEFAVVFRRLWLRWSRQRIGDPEQQCGCRLCSARTCRQRVGTVSCVDGRRRGTPVRDHGRGSDRGECGPGPAGNDASVLGNGLAGNAVRHAARRGRETAGARVRSRCLNEFSCWHECKVARPPWNSG